MRKLQLRVFPTLDRHKKDSETPLLFLLGVSSALAGQVVVVVVEDSTFNHILAIPINFREIYQ